MSYETITEELKDGIVTLTLNRPDRLNAWTFQMGDELSTALKSGNDDPGVEAFVVTGAGREFCAGADVKDLFRAQADAGEVSRGSSNPGGWVRLVRASKPIVAAINGAAIGVGLSQILSMDFIVASSTAKLSCRFVKMGVVPELACSHFLMRRCGLGLASEMMLSGKTIDAHEALRIGLVDRVTDPDDLLAEATAVAKSMGENPQEALAMVKALITDNMVESDLQKVQKREQNALMQCFESAEHKEAISAFLEKRDPDFRKARRSA
ncbi:MAG: enoyl-CoA hydratase-related protein [Gammaproteobacteria bacterium]|nr:enoyl-CoA hydratase-related protein [Gammaproteobacteria bacterium]